MTTKAVDVALAHAANGHPVFAVPLPWKGREGHYQKAAFAGSHGHLDASTDPDTIRRLFRGRRATVAIALPDGTAVLDEDAPGAFASAGIEVPAKAVRVTTPRPGTHAYVRVPAGTRGTSGQDWDLKSAGGWVMAPGAVAQDGATWDGPVPLPPSSDWPLLNGTAFARVKEHSSTFADNLAADTVPEHRRNDVLKDHAWVLAEHLHEQELLAALRAINEARCDPPLDDKEVAAIAHHAARRRERSDLFVPRIKRHDEEGDPAGDNALTAWTFRDLIVAEFAYTPERIARLLPGVGLAVTIAAEKAGKSLLHLQEAICVSGGQPFLGHAVIQCPVLLIEEEGSIGAFQERVIRQANALGVTGLDLPITYMIRQRVRVDDPAWIEALDREVKRTGAKLVLMGPLSMLADVEDENKAASFNRVARALGNLAASNDALVQLAHHRRKDDVRVGPPKSVKAFFDSTRGSSALMAAVDGAVGILREPEDTDGTLYVLQRDGEARRMRLRLDFETLAFSVDETAPLSNVDADADEYDAWLIAVNTWVSRGDAAAHFGVTKNTATQRLDRLVDNRRAERRTGTRGAIEYRAITVHRTPINTPKGGVLIDRSRSGPINGAIDRSSEPETDDLAGTDQDRSTLRLIGDRSKGRLIGRDTHRMKDGTKFVVSRIRKEQAHD